jgi:uncharacterized membrane protein YcaP (DUF421 family)
MCSSVVKFMLLNSLDFLGDRMIDALTKVLVIVVTLMLGAVILGQIANALTNMLNNINNLLIFVML